MKLRVLGRYRNGATGYDAGLVIDVTDAMGAFLLRDSPGSFAIEGDEAPALPDSIAETVTGINAPDRRGRSGLRR